tara:strand:+ start:1602 stop:1823 length:222 start_codon:yes stop_codon:yes gene_type:complete
VLIADKDQRARSRVTGLTLLGNLKVNELRQRAEAAKERSEAAAERYHDSIKTMISLPEDKREAKPSKKFLRIF